MRTSNIVPRTGYLITKKEETVTKEGLEYEENTDDFLVYAQVVVSSSLNYSKGEFVIYHVIEAQEFGDGSLIYNFIHEDNILGTYVPSTATDKE